jgi:hypothetical protein
VPLIAATESTLAIVSSPVFDEASGRAAGGAWVVELPNSRLVRLPTASPPVYGWLVDEQGETFVCLAHYGSGVSAWRVGRASNSIEFLWERPIPQPGTIRAGIRDDEISIVSGRTIRLLSRTDGSERERIPGTFLAAGRSTGTPCYLRRSGRSTLHLAFDGSPVKVDARSFAVLAASFGSDFVLVSETEGWLRLLEPDGHERWAVRLPEYWNGVHVRPAADDSDVHLVLVKRADTGDGVIVAYAFDGAEYSTKVPLVSDSRPAANWRYLLGYNATQVERGPAAYEILTGRLYPVEVS